MVCKTNRCGAVTAGGEKCKRCVEKGQQCFQHRKGKGKARPIGGLGGGVGAGKYLPPANQVLKALDVKPLQTGTFTTRAKMDDVFEASGIRWSISSGGGQPTDQTRQASLQAHLDPG